MTTANDGDWDQVETDVWTRVKCGARRLRVRKVGSVWAWDSSAVEDGEVLDEGLADSFDDAVNAANESEA